MAFLDKGFSFSERLTTIDHITWCTTPCDKGVWGGREAGWVKRIWSDGENCYCQTPPPTVKGNVIIIV